MTPTHAELVQRLERLATLIQDFRERAGYEVFEHTIEHRELASTRPVLQAITMYSWARVDWPADSDLIEVFIDFEDPQPGDALQMTLRAPTYREAETLVAEAIHDQLSE